MTFRIIEISTCLVERGFDANVLLQNLLTSSFHSKCKKNYNCTTTDMILVARLWNHRGAKIQTLLIM